MDAACREIGFFVATEHGIPADLSDEVLALARRFFALPERDKEALSIERSTNHTGYVGLERERLHPELRADAKECLDLGLESAATPGDPGTEHEPASSYPPLPGFRTTVATYPAAALSAACEVLRGMERALDTPRAFLGVMDEPQCFLRLLHYPPIGAPRHEDQLGCGTHTDYGLITLLLTDGVGGLEVRDRGGRWIAIDASPGTVVVNLGDMLARWMNDRYLSTPHRVVNPSGAHRYSAPFFVNPSPDAVVAPLPGCVDADHPSRYEPITSGAYLQTRFDDTHEYRQGR